MNIYGKKVLLRALTLSDRDLVCDLFNDPEIENDVIGWAFPLSKDTYDEWLNNTLKDENKHRFIVESPDDGSVGVISLTDIDWKNKKATHGIKFLKKENRNKGYGTDALMALMKFAFEELGIHRLETTIFTTNEASIALHKKCGWKEEGLQREAIFKNNCFKDVLIFSILDSEYKALIDKTNYMINENFILKEE